MSILNLFHWSYWFAASPAAQGWVRVVLIILPIVAIVSGVILKILEVSGKDMVMKKVYHRLATVALFFGGTVGLWVVLRQVETPLLSARFWPLLIVVITLWWLYQVIQYITKRVPEIRKENAERMEKERYLPKRS